MNKQQQIEYRKKMVDEIDVYNDPVICGFTLTAKMECVVHVSTSCLLNDYCNARMKCGENICAECFAQAVLNHYSALNVNCEHNHLLLTDHILDPIQWRQLEQVKPDQLVRFEAFGDLANDIQVANYFIACYLFPHLKFALWTKNPWLVKIAISKGYKKPSNLEIVYSPQKMNDNKDGLEAIKKYSFIDKVFTVYTSDYALENDVCINCGNKQCDKCKTCYLKQKNIVFINEILKKDLNRYLQSGGEIK